MVPRLATTATSPKAGTMAVRATSPTGMPQLTMMDVATAGTRRAMAARNRLVRWLGTPARMAACTDTRRARSAAAYPAGVNNGLHTWPINACTACPCRLLASMYVTRVVADNTSFQGSRDCPVRPVRPWWLCRSS